jgi:hypothetical protein
VTRAAVGVYNVVIPGLSGFYFSHEITQITPLDARSPAIAGIGSVGGDLLVELYDKTGAHVAYGFSLVSATDRRTVQAALLRQRREHLDPRASI